MPFHVCFRFKCKRCVNGIQMHLPPAESDCTSDLSQWFHASKNRGVPDEILEAAWNVTQNVSFVFHHRSAEQKIEPSEEEKESKKAKKKQEYCDDDGDYDENVVEIDDDSGDEDYK